DLHPRPVMDGDFAVSCPLVRPGLPEIRFLFVRSRFGSTLLSDAASRRRPCASLALHLHQVVQGTCTPKLSNMLGTQLTASRRFQWRRLVPETEATRSPAASFVPDIQAVPWSLRNPTRIRISRVESSGAHRPVLGAEAADSLRHHPTIGLPANT